MQHAWMHTRAQLISLIWGRGAESRGPLRGTEETMKGFKEAIDLSGTAKPSLSVYVTGGDIKGRRGRGGRQADREGHSRRKGGLSEAGRDKWMNRDR